MIRMMSLTKTIAASLAVSTHLVASEIIATGRTITVGGIAYYVPPSAIATVPALAQRRKPSAQSDDLRPLTVVTTTVMNYNSTALNETMVRLEGGDDVYGSAFRETVYVQDLRKGQVMYNTTLAHSQVQNPEGTTNVVVGRATMNGTIMKPGPYFVSTHGRIYEAWRLYSDSAGAFSETTIAASTPNTYAVLPATVLGQSLAVAVPSRHYFTPTAEKPLAGVRLGVKDIYDIAGLRTSNGNRAWYWFYSPANVTAPAIQRLIDAGAIIVGKMKTSQFANGQSATADWIDYHAPFNPRADGYNDAGSSSSGPATGIAAYPWLDLAIGSDTGDSIRAPAALQGIYGNRPSHGLVTLDGTMPLAPELDTAGFLVRDPQLWINASKVLYLDNLTVPETSSFPKRIIAYGFGPAEGISPIHSALLARLTSFVDGALEQVDDLSGLWNATRPAVAGNTTIDSYLNRTYPVIISARQRALVRDPFYAAYASRHNGRRPAIDPVPLVRWNYTQNMADEEIDQEYRRREVFEDWFGNKVLVHDNETCSNALLVYVASSMTPKPRNRYLSPPTLPFGFDISRASSFSGAPDFVFPLGVAPYKSTITGQTEYMPISVDIMAAKGCDGLLFALVRDLAKAGILNTSLTGYSSTDGGEVLF